MRPRCIAIVGATATGKTALAIALAEKLGGEVINADSRQVYRGMNIGTAKPTPAEQARARHWLVDIADPDEPYSLVAFLDDARAAFDDIAARGKTPIIAGGTGQYIWALLEGWDVPRVPPDALLRAELVAVAEQQGAAAVARQLAAIDPDAAASIDGANVRRMIRAIEVTRATGRRFSEWQRERVAAPDATVLGLRLSRETLYAHIDARVDAMISGGFEREVRGLIAAGYGCGLRSMSGIGYRQMCAYLAGECTLADAIARMKTETHRLARMQHAWFAEDDARIRWLDAASPALVADALAIAVGGASGGGRAALS